MEAVPPGLGGELLLLLLLEVEVEVETVLLQLSPAPKTTLINGITVG